MYFLLGESNEKICSSLQIIARNNNCVIKKWNKCRELSRMVAMGGRWGEGIRDKE